MKKALSPSLDLSPVKKREGGGGVLTGRQRHLALKRFLSTSKYYRELSVKTAQFELNGGISCF